ncbi:MAG: hypothetical protein ACTS22_10435 [Phycisphaerales bacterium]
MHRFTAGIVVACAGLSSSVAVSQPVDTLVTPIQISGTTWQLVAEFIGAPGPGPIATIWSDLNFNYASTDGIFTDIQLNQGYVTSLLGAPVINGLGTSELEIRATMPAGVLANPDLDGSNPLVVATFEYTGTTFGLFDAVFQGQTRLVGQNTIVYEQSAFPFADVEFYQNAFDEPGTRRLQFFIPAPSAAAVLGLSGLATVRRRR